MNSSLGNRVHAESISTNIDMIALWNSSCTNRCETGRSLEGGPSRTIKPTYAATATNA